VREISWIDLRLDEARARDRALGHGARQVLVRDPAWGRGCTTEAGDPSSPAHAHRHVLYAHLEDVDAAVVQHLLTEGVHAARGEGTG